MKAEDLTVRSLEGMEVRVNMQGTHDVHAIHNFTIETNMRTGEPVVILVLEPEPESTSARDYEPHPGFPEFNDWLYNED